MGRPPTPLPPVGSRFLLYFPAKFQWKMKDKQHHLLSDTHTYAQPPSQWNMQTHVGNQAHTFLSGLHSRQGETMGEITVFNHLRARRRAARSSLSSAPCVKNILPFTAISRGARCVASSRKRSKTQIVNHLACTTSTRSRSSSLSRLPCYNQQ